MSADGSWMGYGPSPINDPTQFTVFVADVAFRFAAPAGSCEPLYAALENLHGGPLARLAEEALGKREVQRLVEEARKPPEH